MMVKYSSHRQMASNVLYIFSCFLTLFKLKCYLNLYKIKQLSAENKTTYKFTCSVRCYIIKVESLLTHSLDSCF